MRTPVEVVRLYLHDVWDDGGVELVREICADPLVRHDLESTTKLSHQEQIDRILGDKQKWAPRFTEIVLSGDEQFASLVYTGNGTKIDRAISGIEIFKVTDGRITDVWNSLYMEGQWG